MNAPDAFDKAKAHVDANLKQGCQELVAWNDTGILPDGVVRKTANFLRESYPLDALGHAENLYTKAALRKVAEG